MPLMTTFAGPSAAAAQAYIDKIKAIETANLIALWHQNETSGTNADNYEGTAARDGTWTGVTLNDSTGPDGEPVPLYDGANDFLNIYSTSLRDAWNGNAGTLLAWVKMYDAGVWTDGQWRALVDVRVDGNNLAALLKPSINGEMRGYYKAGGTEEIIGTSSQSGVGWELWSLTWDSVADEVKLYKNETRVGALATGLGVWSGDVSSTLATVGSSGLTPANVTYGWLGPVGIYKKALALSDIQSWATV